MLPEAAFAGAAGDLDVVELVVAGDWLVRLKKTTPVELQAYAATLTGRHPVTVRRAAALVRERVDSPPESRLRMCLVLAGLPEPECNVDLGGDSFFIATSDLAYLVYRLLLEYEGDHHRTDRGQWQKDIRRERQLRQAGFEVQRITAETLRRPSQLVEDVHGLLSRLATTARVRPSRPTGSHTSRRGDRHGTLWGLGRAHDPGEVPLDQSGDQPGRPPNIRQPPALTR